MARRSAGALTAREDCVYGARHLPPLIYLTPLGEKRAAVDWQDQQPGPDGKRHDHRLRPVGAAQRCRFCGLRAMLSDCQGRPCHKVCLERHILESAS